jgi:mannose-6-phosphate isomerase-like protein (cupin superfamily)
VSGYRVAAPTSFAPPTWAPEDERRVVELRDAGLRHSQANLWRYSPGVANRRHVEPLQEEVFCVVSGTLAVYLGEPAERVELTAGGVVVLEPGTAVQLRNETAEDVVFFAYGAPAQDSSYVAEKLEDAYF